MAQPYYPTIRVGLETRDRKIDDDTIYWKRMQQVSVFAEPNHVTSVATCPKKPYNVACTSSIRLSIYDTQLCQPVTVFSRFKAPVYGAVFRQDGGLLAIGGEDGKFKLFDLEHFTGKNKLPIRSTKVSPNPLHTVRFNASGRNLYTMADDGIVKCFDIANTDNEPLLEIKDAHTDSIRTAAASKTNDHLILTGGYDHKVKLWDTRCSSLGGPSVSMDVGYPTEDLVLFPNENLLATAAGSIIKVWDLMAGGRLLTSLQAHHKTVTSLCLGQMGSALISAGIDKRINVFRISDFNLVHSFSMPSPVLGVSISPDDQTMSIGMGSLLAVHRRAPAKKANISVDQSDKKSKVRMSAPIPVTQERNGLKIAKEVQGKASDQLRLSRVDVLLRGYKHHAAVTKMFCNYFTGVPDLVVGWLRVLVYRQAIRRAIAGQSHSTQVQIIKFLSRHLFNHAFFETLNAVAEAVFDVFSQDEELAPDVAKQMVRLKDAVGRELTVQKQLNQTIGAFELIVNSARAVTTCNDLPDEEDIFGEPIITAVRIKLTDEQPISDKVETK